MHSYTWNHKHVIFECDHYKNVWYLTIDINILGLDIYAKWHELCPLCSVPIFLTSSLHELIYILYLISYVLFPPSCFFNIYSVISVFWSMLQHQCFVIYNLCYLYLFCVLCSMFVFCDLCLILCVLCSVLCVLCSIIIYLCFLFCDMCSVLSFLYNVFFCYTSTWQQNE
jgi:hypothetical protein